MNLRTALLFVFCVASFSAYADTPTAVPAAVTMINVPVLNRDVARGDTITEADIVYQAVPTVRASADIARDANDISGKSARRFLRAGELVRSSDVKVPVIIAKGDMVTMVFETPGLSLSSTGKAMAEGGIGESIPVLNPTSHRQIDATVIGTGKVRVGVTSSNPGPLASAAP